MNRIYSSCLIGMLLLGPGAAFAAPLAPGILGPLHFTYPSDWKWKDATVGTEVMLKSPVPEYMGNFDIIAGMWVRNQRLSTPVTADKLDSIFVADSTISEKNTLSDWYRANFQLIAKNDATLLGAPARQYEYTATWGSVPVRGITILGTNKDRLVSVTLYVTGESYPQFLPIFEATAASLFYSEATTVKRGLSKIPAVKKAASSSSSSSSSKVVRKKVMLKKPVLKKASSSSSSRSSVR